MGKKAILEIKPLRSQSFCEGTGSKNLRWMENITRCARLPEAHNTGEIALNADRMMVEGAVFLDDFHSYGEVRLPGARIKDVLSCRDSQFFNTGKVALNAASITVEGDVFLGECFRIDGILNLMNAVVGQLFDNPDCWSGPDTLNIQGLVYTTIEPSDIKTRLRWLELQPSTSFYPQPYEQFAQFLRRIGHETDAKRVAIARENARLKKGDLPWWSRLWKQVLRITLHTPWLYARMGFGMGSGYCAVRWNPLLLWRCSGSYDTSQGTDI